MSSVYQTDRHNDSRKSNNTIGNARRVSKPRRHWPPPEQVARSAWQGIENDGRPQTTDRILAIGALCGFDGEIAAWGGYLKAREGSL